MANAQHRATAVLDAKLDQARREAKELAATVDKLSKSLEDTSRRGTEAQRALFAVGKSKVTIADMAGAFTSVRTAVGDVVSVAAEAARIVGELADRSLELSNVYGNLSFSIDTARAATGGLINDFELAKAANQAVALGIVDSADEFANLASAAQKLGAKVGQGPVASLDSLNAALGRGSTEMLDNLGIVLKQQQAQQIYAAQLGKTTKQLTDAERAEAFQRVALQKITEAAEQVALKTDGAGAAVKRFRVELDNLRDGALGAERPTISLTEGIAALSDEQRKLVRESGTFNTSFVQARAALRDLGVEADQLKGSWREYVRVLDAVELAHKRAILDARANPQKVNEALMGMAGSMKTVNVEADKLNARDMLGTLEEQLIIVKNTTGSRKLEIGIIQEKARLEATIADAEGDHEKAAQIRREARLEQIRVENEKTKKQAHDRFKAERKFFELQLEQARMAENLLKLDRARLEARRQFDAELAQAKGPGADFERLGEIRAEQAAESERAAQDAILNERLRGIEEQRAQGVDTLTLIEREREARVAHLEFLHEHAASRAEQERLQDQMRQVHHEANMGRLAEEKAAEEERIRVVNKATSIGEKAANTAVMSFLSIKDAQDAARQSALAQGKTQQEAARAAEIAGLRAQAAVGTRIRNEMIAFAISQLAMGVGTLFTNQAESASHFAAFGIATAAAVVAGSVARGQNARASSMSAQSANSGPSPFGFGGGGGFGGAANGPPSSQGDGELEGGDSEIPGSQAPQAPQAGGNSGQQKGGSTTINGDVHLYGTPKREFMEAVDDGLLDLSRSKRLRSREAG
jgi:hypothetical protein